MHYCSGDQRHAWDDPADAAKCCNGYERAHRVSRRSDGTLHVTYYWRRTARTRRTVVETPTSVDRPLDVPHDAFFKRLGEAGRDLGSGSPSPLGWWPCAWSSGARCSAIRRRARRGFGSSWRCGGPCGPWTRGRSRVALSAVIDAVDADASGVTGRLIVALSTYGHQLETDGEWRLAADVFGVAIACAAARDDRAPQPALYFHIGLCRRKLGDVDGAHAAYRSGV